MKAYILNNSGKVLWLWFCVASRIKMAFSDAAFSLFWSSDSLQPFFFKLKKEAFLGGFFFLVVATRAHSH